MLIYHTAVSLDEGFKIFDEPKESRLIKGRRVGLPSGYKLFQHLLETGSPMKCWSCGLEANCFIVNKGRNDHMGSPTLDLYSTQKGGPVLMTRDHIIPKSYGGVNDVANLRVGCGPCNHHRGNELDAADVEFMRAHPELIRSDAKLTIAEGVTSMPKSIDKVMVTAGGQSARQEKLIARRIKVKEKKAKKKVNQFPKLTSMMVLALA